MTDPLVLEAVVNDGLEEKIRKRWTFIYNVGNKSWVRFNQVPLGEGYRRFRVVYGNATDSLRHVEVRLDSVEGPLVGSVPLSRTDRPRTGRIQIYGEAVAELAPKATGNRDVFVVFHAADNQPVGEFEYFRFEQYRGDLPLGKNEVKLELRVGSRTGPKIGEFYPRQTGTANRSCDFVCSLEPVQGTQPLFLVVRSAVAGPIGRFDRLTLQKASQGPHALNVGMPPRIDDQGRMVLPEPTHRPRSRPGDAYIEQRMARRGQQPLIAATRLTDTPTIDGRLDDEWLETARDLTLRESFDGSESMVVPSIAWVGYDQNALYVAARHPVQDTRRLRDRTHLTAPTDYVELAFGSHTDEMLPLSLKGYPDGHFEVGEPGDSPFALLNTTRESVTYRGVSRPRRGCANGGYRFPHAGLRRANLRCLPLIWPFDMVTATRGPSGGERAVLPTKSTTPEHCFSRRSAPPLSRFPKWGLSRGLMRRRLRRSGRTRMPRCPSGRTRVDAVATPCRSRPRSGRRSSQQV